MDIYLTYFNSIWFYTLFVVHLHSDWDLPSRTDMVFLHFVCYINTQKVSNLSFRLKLLWQKCFPPPVCPPPLPHLILWMDYSDILPRYASVYSWLSLNPCTTPQPLSHSSFYPQCTQNCSWFKRGEHLFQINSASEQMCLKPPKPSTV